MAAHAHGIDGIAAAVRAGVDTIEHCSWVDSNGRWGNDRASIVSEIAARDISVCPTVGAGWLKNVYLQQSQAPALERMRKAGVKLIAGSDAGAIPNLAFHRLADGLVCMAQMSGMSNAEALRAATSDAAAALGLADTCGSIIEGLSADIMLVHGNPIEDLEVLCAPPSFIIARGEAVVPCIGAAPETAVGQQARWTLFGGRDRRHCSVTRPSPLGSSARCPCVKQCG